MIKSDFNIKNIDNTIIMEKDNNMIFIRQSSDNDIWFNTKGEEGKIDLYATTDNYAEWEIYKKVEDLIKLIIGRYIINDHFHPYNSLPKNFINLQDKEIIWYSDNEPTSYLKFKINLGMISIVIKKIKDVSYISNCVRIRTNGSSYGQYFHEFLKFYKNLNEYSKEKGYQKTIK